MRESAIAMTSKALKLLKYLSGEMFSPKKSCAISCAMKLKILEAFRRNETAKEKGTYKIPPLKLKRKKQRKKVVELNKTKRTCQDF